MLPGAFYKTCLYWKASNHRPNSHNAPRGVSTSPMHFQSPAPLEEPILILTGEGYDLRSSMMKKTVEVLILWIEKILLPRFRLRRPFIMIIPIKKMRGYDTALQVIHHTARDWTYGAMSCRDETIGWIVRETLTLIIAQVEMQNGPP